MWKRLIRRWLLAGALLYWTGCNVRVAEQVRPLVRCEPLQSDLEVVVQDRRDEQGIAGDMRQGSNTVMEEWVHTQTRGDVYHRDALRYDVALGVGLAQHRSDTELGRERRDGSLTEYRLSLHALEKKPVTVRLDADRSEEVLPRQFLGSLETQRQGRGAAVFWRSKRWPMSLQVDRSQTTHDGISNLSEDFFARDDTRWRYSVSHRSSERQTLRVDVNRDDMSQQTVGSHTQTRTDGLTASHQWRWGPRLASRLDSMLSAVDQQGDFEYRNTRWQERLRWQHTPALASLLDARWVDTRRPTSHSREARGLWGLEHRLYESLVTRADGFLSRTDLEVQGRLRQQGGRLSLNYRKRNRFGVFFAGYQGYLSRLEQTGGGGLGTVVDEPHVAQGLEPIQLNRTGIDTDTLVVTNASGGVLQEGDDYQVTERDGRVWLDVTTVGAGPAPNLSDGETFTVSYDFYIEPRRREDTVRQSVTLRQRFGTRWSVGLDHRRQREQVESSVTSVTPDEYTTDRLSVDYADRRLSLRAEVARERSTQVPSRSRRLDVRYRLPGGGRGVHVSVRGSAQWLQFDPPDQRDVRLWQAGTQATVLLGESSEWVSRFDVRRERDSRFGDVRGTQLDSRWQLRYRDVSIRVGLEISRLHRRQDQINHRAWYLRIKRSF